MKNLYHSLLLLIAGSTQKELAAQIRYLKIENELLRSKLPDRVSVTDRERNRLVKFASKLGRALNELVTIVHPRTMGRWISEASQSKKRKRAKRGRPKTEEQIRELILLLARENDWGYTRILGELKKLGIQSISRNTVKNILKENGLDPGPKRGAGTWDEFLKIHAATLWQCDFFSKRVLTIKGFRELYLLVFLHVETRRVFIAPSTFHPDETWVMEQARAFLKHVEGTGLGASIVMHDRDTKFTAAFDQVLKSAGLKITKTAYRSPNTTLSWNGSSRHCNRNASTTSSCSASRTWTTSSPRWSLTITRSGRTRRWKMACQCPPRRGWRWPTPSNGSRRQKLKG